MLPWRQALPGRAFTCTTLTDAGQARTSRDRFSIMENPRQARTSRVWICAFRKSPLCALWGYGYESDKFI